MAEGFTEISLGPAGELDCSAVPNQPGVFLVWTRGGAPHIGKTSLLRRRLARLLRPPEKQSRLLNLAHVATRIAYRATGSPFESAVTLYRLARRHRPDDYRKFLKLRPPPLLKLNLSNPYPRCYITRRLAADHALYFGPFTSRNAAERFQNAFLDLFQLRRCREEIHPHPDHPGCMYGEMNMCLRPCQAAVSAEQYRGEAGQVAEFLSTQGESLVRQLQSERDRSSAELEFEQAARAHKMLEKTLQALQLNEELARDLDHLYGVIVQASTEPNSVELWFVYQGFLQPRRRFTFAEEGQPLSLDRKLREMIAAIEFRRGSPRERSEHLALLVRWYSSSWKQGELLLFGGLDRVPYRKLVRAISRVAAKQSASGLAAPRA
jgi:excinuclease ABC subunit C